MLDCLYLYLTAGHQVDLKTICKKQQKLIVIGSLVVVAWLCWEWRCCVAYNPSPIAKTLFSSMDILSVGNTFKNRDDSSSSFQGLRFASNLVIIGRMQEASQLLEMLLKMERLRTDRKCDVHNLSRIFLVYRDIDRSNQLSANDWITLSNPIRLEAERAYEYYKKVVPNSTSLNDESVASIFRILSERYEAHHCLTEAIECQRTAVIAEKETQRANSLLYHTLLYQLAVLYHKNNMDKEAVSVVNQTIALPEGVTAIGTTDEWFKKNHIKKCKELLSSLRN